MKVSKEIIFDKEAREKMKAGIDKLAKAVGSTLGPKGRNVIYEREFNIPIVVNDGVTIAREIVLEDKFENIGCELLKEAAIQTNDIAGDGTTTSIVLASELINQAFMQIKNGVNPMDLKRKMEIELENLLKELPKYKIEIKDNDWEMVNQVASVSANNDESIGKAITEAIKEVGRDGVITVEEKYGTGIELEVQKGFQFNSGFIHPWLITNRERKEAELKEVPILSVQFKVTSIQDIADILKPMVEKRIKDMVLIAPEISHDALAVILAAKRNGEFNCLAIKGPYVADRQLAYIEDIAIYTGGKVLGPHDNPKTITEEHFGEVKRIISTMNHTTLIEGKGTEEQIQNRIKELKNSVDGASDEFDKQIIRERFSKLQDGIAVLKVGALSEPEMKEKKYRIEDAINATQAALEEGVVVGGGITFYKLGNGKGKLISAPLYKISVKIISNAGKNPEKVTQAIAQQHQFGGVNCGYNALTDKIENLEKSGILDPYKVIRTTLENSFSIAMMILSSNTVVAFKDDPAKARIV